MPLILKYAPDVVFRETGNLFIVFFNRPSFLDQEGEEEEATQEKKKDPKEVILDTLKKPVSSGMWDRPRRGGGK